MLDQDATSASRYRRRRAVGLAPIITRLGGAGLVLVVLGLGLGLALVGRHGGGPLQGWDNTVWRWSIGHRGPLVGVDKVIARVGDAPFLGPLCVAVAVVMFAVRRSPRALLPIVGYLGGEALVFLVRAVVHRDRPVTANYPATGALRGVHETSYSFPSGHAVAVTAVLFALGGALAITRRWWWPWLAALIGSAYVADSRLLLGVHWFSDVAFGMVLGIAWGVVVARLVAPLAWSDLRLRPRQHADVTAMPADNEPG